MQVQLYENLLRNFCRMELKKQVQITRYLRHHTMYVVQDNGHLFWGLMIDCHKSIKSKRLLNRKVEVHN